MIEVHGVRGLRDDRVGREQAQHVDATGDHLRLGDPIDLSAAAEPGDTGATVVNLRGTDGQRLRVETGVTDSAGGVAGAHDDGDACVANLLDGGRQRVGAERVLRPLVGQGQVGDIDARRVRRDPVETAQDAGQARRTVLLGDADHDHRRSRGHAEGPPAGAFDRTAGDEVGHERAMPVAVVVGATGGDGLAVRYSGGVGPVDEPPGGAIEGEGVGDAGVDHGDAYASACTTLAGVAAKSGRGQHTLGAAVAVLAAGELEGIVGREAGHAVGPDQVPQGGRRPAHHAHVQRRERRQDLDAGDLRQHSPVGDHRLDQRTRGGCRSQARTQKGRGHRAGSGAADGC